MIMFLKNLLLSLGIIGVSTLHFASAAHAAGGQIQLFNGSPQSVLVSNYTATSGVTPSSIPLLTVLTGATSTIANASGPDKQNISIQFEVKSASTTQQYGCSFNIILSYSSSLHEYYSNYQAFPMSFPNETYFPTCTAPASGPWSGVGYLGGYFSIK
jgi:hypothetical protein